MQNTPIIVSIFLCAGGGMWGGGTHHLADIANLVDLIEEMELTNEVASIIPAELEKMTPEMAMQSTTTQK